MESEAEPRPMKGFLVFYTVSLSLIICVVLSDVKLQYMIYTSSQKNTKLLPITSPNVNGFSKFFRRQTRLYERVQQDRIEISHHTLDMSLHYLLKYLCSKTCNAQQVIEANCHVRHSHSKNCFIIFVW